MHSRLNAGKDPAAVLQALEISEATLIRWRAQYGGMKSEEAKRLIGPDKTYPSGIAHRVAMRKHMMAAAISFQAC
jgi:hypothetical protein